MTQDSLVLLSPSENASQTEEGKMIWGRECLWPRVNEEKRIQFMHLTLLARESLPKKKRFLIVFFVVNSILLFFNPIKFEAVEGWSDRIMLIVEFWFRLRVIWSFRWWEDESHLRLKHFLDCHVDFGCQLRNEVIKCRVKKFFSNLSRSSILFHYTRKFFEAEIKKGIVVNKTKNIVIM